MAEAAEKRQKEVMTLFLTYFITWCSKVEFNFNTVNSCKQLKGCLVIIYKAGLGFFIFKLYAVSLDSQNVLLAPTH